MELSLMQFVDEFQFSIDLYTTVNNGRGIIAPKSCEWSLIGYLCVPLGRLLVRQCHVWGPH